MYPFRHEGENVRRSTATPIKSPQNCVKRSNFGCSRTLGRIIVSSWISKFNAIAIIASQFSLGFNSTISGRENGMIVLRKSFKLIYIAIVAILLQISLKVYLCAVISMVIKYVSWFCVISERPNNVHLWYLCLLNPTIRTFVTVQRWL